MQRALIECWSCEVCPLSDTQSPPKSVDRSWTHLHNSGNDEGNNGEKSEPSGVNESNKNGEEQEVTNDNDKTKSKESENCIDIMETSRKLQNLRKALSGRER